MAVVTKLERLREFAFDQRYRVPKVPGTESALAVQGTPGLVAR